MNVLFMILGILLFIVRGVYASTAFVKGGEVKKQRIGIAVFLFIIGFVLMVMSSPLTQ